MKLQSRLRAAVFCAAFAVQLLSSGYILRAADGTIAVWDAATGQCIRQTQTALSSLPSQDRALLTDGVELETLPELTQALEDFCS
jgi:hypothetical protein